MRALEIKGLQRKNPTKSARQRWRIDASEASGVRVERYRPTPAKAVTSYPIFRVRFTSSKALFRVLLRHVAAAELYLEPNFVRWRGTSLVRHGRSRLCLNSDCASLFDVRRSNPSRTQISDERQRLCRPSSGCGSATRAAVVLPASRHENIFDTGRRRYAQSRRTTGVSLHRVARMWGRHVDCLD
jgi:hypothetical protein